MPRAVRPAASAEAWASISRQVQDLSPQMKPVRSAWRRAFWVSICARFITRRDIRARPPRGTGSVTVSVTWNQPTLWKQHGKLSRNDSRKPAASSNSPRPWHHRKPVPLQRWHLTTLSPFFSKPLPSQFLHFCFFLMFGPFSLAMVISSEALPAHLSEPRLPVHKHRPTI